MYHGRNAQQRTVAAPSSFASV